MSAATAEGATSLAEEPRSDDSYTAALAIKALLFDFDGVLWDSEVAGLESWRETYAEYGQQLSLDRFATRLGTLGGADFIAELQRLAGTPLDLETVELRRWERKMELVRKLKPRPGILDYIAESRERGLCVALVSTDDTEWIMTGLNILGLRDAFDFIECAEGVRSLAKPSPCPVPERTGPATAVRRRSDCDRGLAERHSCCEGRRSLLPRLRERRDPPTWT
jgi:haloacid dehalogenase-like hydrolase